jgi:hypothetical protein
MLQYHQQYHNPQPIPAANHSFNLFDADDGAGNFDPQQCQQVIELDNDDEAEAEV